MKQADRVFVPILVAALVLSALAAGCGPTAASSRLERDKATLDLADALRDEALQISDVSQRDRLVTGLTQLRQLVLGETLLKPTTAEGSDSALPLPDGGAATAPKWATLFAPTNLVIGFFTRSKDFNGDGADDGLEVRLQPLDQFGDPTKAVGSYRIEVFQYRVRTSEPRGDRLGHWFVSVLDADSSRRYYDPVDRSYVFPLQWDSAIEAGTRVIIQATYYPPAGFHDKLFAQRVIKIGPQE